MSNISFSPTPSHKRFRSEDDDDSSEYSDATYQSDQSGRYQDGTDRHVLGTAICVAPGELLNDQHQRSNGL